MHPSLLRIAYALALAAAMAAPAFGQSIVVPNSNATVKGNDTSGPLTGFSSFQDQTVIDPDQLPPGPISSLGLRIGRPPVRERSMSPSAGIFFCPPAPIGRIRRDTR